MSDTEIVKPQFSSEAEEADWYAANPGYVLQQLRTAKAEGRLGQGTMAKLAGMVSMAVTLSAEDVARAQAQASKRGVMYEMYVNELVHRALDEAERAA